MGSVRRIERELIARLGSGEHLFLYGPHGIGKTTLIGRLHAHFLRAGTPCGLSSATACLGDVTCAFEGAYPAVDTAGIGRRRARSRLVMAADGNAGVLLLDEVTRMGTAMCGFLRRLRRGFVAVLLAADVEAECDLQRLKQWYFGTCRLAMVPAPAARLRPLFRRHCTAAARNAPRIPSDVERRIVRAACGRPAWIIECAQRVSQPRYWRGETLLVETLCMDTEIALRQGRLNLMPPVDDMSAPTPFARTSG